LRTADGVLASVRAATLPLPALDADAWHARFLDGAEAAGESVAHAFRMLREDPVAFFSGHCCFTGCLFRERHAPAPCCASRRASTCWEAGRRRSTRAKQPLARCQRELLTDDELHATQCYAACSRCNICVLMSETLACVNIAALFSLQRTHRKPIFDRGNSK
jgi:hypothetical protein